MAWIWIDDQMPEHPKVAQLSPVEGWLHVCGICYASRTRTDGFIPYRVAHRLIEEDSQRPIEDAPFRVIPVLVAAGLWEEVPGGYQIHDYLDYQPSAGELAKRALTNRQRQRRFRQRQRPPTDEAGVSHAVSNAVSNAVTNASDNGPVTGNSHVHVHPSEDRSLEKDTRAHIARAREPQPHYAIDAARLEFMAAWNEETGPPFPAVANPAGWRDIDAALRASSDLAQWRERFGRVRRSRFLRETAQVAPASLWFVLNHVNELDAGHFDDRPAKPDAKKTASREAIARFVARGAPS